MTDARRRLRLGLLLVALGIAIGVAVTLVGEPPFDPALVAAARELRAGLLLDTLMLATRIGYALWLVPITLAISLWYGIGLGRWRDALVVAFSTVLAAVVTRILKETFDRARPADGAELLAAGFSMPSGHATSSAAFAASILLATHPTALGRGARVAAVLFALLVGLSRVVLGVHYPSDVVAGFLVGAGMAFLVGGCVGRIPRRLTAANPVV